MYEEKKAIIIHSILEAKKLHIENRKFILFTEKRPLNSIEEHEIRDILIQFQNLHKLKVENVYIGKPSPILKSFYLHIGQPENYIEVSNIEVDYFEKEFLKHKQYLSEEKLPAINNFFIEFNSDRRIMLNGKIDIAKPDFGGTNEAIFIFLYDNPNKLFSKKEIEEETHKEITQSFDKIVENLGFRRGLKAAFFDISDKTSSIKFKNPITL